ncbi:keratin-associated protein 19-2-like isoform X2 [Daphnia pulex]|uniref:keratin-associated protein 19-2-like isoform X2 n=1 Tax=Daphnia pulex TaxID=6669 RepID=UPI001EDE89B4|nr:keratin-associated protein 19-2-like isoform X2 [Daphnia pulex]
MTANFKIMLLIVAMMFVAVTVAKKVKLYYGYGGYGGYGYGGYGYGGYGGYGYPAYGGYGSYEKAYGDYGYEGYDKGYAGHGY